MVVTRSAVEKNIGRIFGKVGLTETDHVNRRTMAVLTYLRATGVTRRLRRVCRWGAGRA